jgi:osmotically-inducible protein OsmY
VTKRYAALLAVYAATSLGCHPSTDDRLGRLTITPAEAATVYTPEQAAALDVGLTASVKLQLLFDRDVSGWQINVDTRDRVVTLEGVADTDADKARAVRIARETHGVACVVDQLIVRTPPRDV